MSTVQQKLDCGATNVTMALLPFAVRLASTFLQKPDIQYVRSQSIHSIDVVCVCFSTSNSRLNSKSSVETVTPTKEEPSAVITKTIETEKASVADTASSNDLYFEFEQTFSSSSELSIALQSLNETSSLSISVLDNQEAIITHDEDVSLTPIQTSSDNESVLYLRLSDELNIVKATWDSDLDKIER